MSPNGPEILETLGFLSFSCAATATSLRLRLRTPHAKRQHASVLLTPSASMTPVNERAPVPARRKQKQQRIETKTYCIFSVYFSFLSAIKAQLLVLVKVTNAHLRIQILNTKQENRGR
ncbi:hypothetical protein V6Z11_A04G170900 [Gossypium hirsutum]